MKIDEQMKKHNDQIDELISSTIQIEHGERFSCVILQNVEADIWCEVSRSEGNNRREMAEEVATAIRYSLYTERLNALKNVLAAWEEK